MENKQCREFLEWLLRRAEEQPEINSVIIIAGLLEFGLAEVFFAGTVREYVDLKDSPAEVASQEADLYKALCDCWDNAFNGVAVLNIATKAIGSYTGTVRGDLGVAGAIARLEAALNNHEGVTGSDPRNTRMSVAPSPIDHTELLKRADEWLKRYPTTEWLGTEYLVRDLMAAVKGGRV